MVTPPPPRRPLRAIGLHALRVGLVVALLLVIPSPAKRIQSDTSQPPALARFDLSRLIDPIPPGIELDPATDANGLWRIRDGANNTLGFVARTLPIAVDVVGYRGPSESAIVLDSDLNVQSVTLLSSADTTEHVAAVQDDDVFFRQFDRWSWGGPPAGVKIDAVSGATLTSLALAEGVMKRLGGDRPSLVFGSELRFDEIQDWFPNGRSLDKTTGIVRDSEGVSLGRVLRTGPLADDLIGYQGPTELLIRFSNENDIERVRIRTSFDNEPYIDYVRTEAGFWNLFYDQSLQELADFDPAASGVEGVSGATMTSLTVADTLVAAAKAAIEQEAATNAAKPNGWTWSGWFQSIRWGSSDLLTIATLVAAGIFSRLRWYHIRWIRRLWLLSTFVVIGLWSGNLLSMALIAGWSAEGIAWRLAPGLSAIAIVALLAPPLTKSNPYCNHLCPHGALQQLIRPAPKSRRHWKLRTRLQRWLLFLPGVTLVAAYVALILFPSIDLSSWEPFHAYLFRIAGWGSLALAILTLAVSAVIPMGYCRLGCPTGKLLDYLRRSAVSNRIAVSDYVAVALLAFALLVRYYGAV